MHRKAGVAGRERRWPWWGLVGIGILAAGLWALVTDLPVWNAVWYVPAWYGYLLLLDAVIFLLQGHSFLSHRRRELGAMLFWSVPFWFLFEAYNLRLQNWYYVFVLRSPWLQAVVAWLAFATVLPAVFFHAELLRASGWLERLRCRPLAVSQAFCLTAGGLSVVLPLLWPRYFFWAVWWAPFWIPAALNYRSGAPSLLRELETGDCRRLLRLLAGGLLAGIVWETLNYWARCKWIYTVPGFEEAKFFEIPAAGLLGFPVLALAAFSAYALLSQQLRGGCHWEEPHPRPVRPIHRGQLALAATAALVLSAVTFAGAYGETARSSRPLLVELEGLGPELAARLRRASVPTPERLVRAVRHQGLQPLAEVAGIELQRLETAYRHATLALHKGMGPRAARLLQEAGIDSVLELATRNAEKLTRRLYRLAAASSVPPPRLAEVKVWIRAARFGRGPRR